MRKLDNKTPNILFRNINEFNIKLILIIGVIFIMLSGYTSYALFTDTIISNNIISLKIGKKNYEKSFSYTGNCEEYTVPYNGYYKIEAWGAQGGSSLLDNGTRDLSNNSTCVADGSGRCIGGLGAYTSGLIKLLKGETLNICVGGKGGNGIKGANSAGGFNGGGSGTWDNSDDEATGGGGGATDIRLVGGTWNNETGLNSRIMVAAGGGGASDAYSGLSGSGLANTSTAYSTTVLNFKNSTQTTGYAFGKGENAVIVRNNYPISGGGSGYYGGYATDSGSSYDNRAGGGTSFISGYAGVNAISKDFEKMQNVRYIKDCVNGNTANEYSHWLELQAYSGGVNVALGKTVTSETTTHSNLNILVDGVIDNNNYVELGNGNKCVVVDLGQTYDIGRINTYFYYEDGRKYNGHSVYVSSNNTNWTTIVENENGVGGTASGTSVSSITHTNDTLHYSNKYFINGKIQAGINSGNGKAKITYVSSTKPERANKALDGVRYIKDCTTGDNSNGYKSWEEIQAIKNGVNIALGKPVTGTGIIYTDSSGNWSYSAVTDGNIANFNDDDAHTLEEGNQCVTVDLGQTYDLDEIAVWHWWKDGGTYNDNYTYVSSNNTDWSLVIDRQEPETSEGKRVNAYEEPSTIHQFSYTGACEEYTVPYNGYYKIEAWGAQGGSTDSSTGGLGGYTSGITKLIKGETLYVCVGQNLNTYSSNYSFNGGGKGSYQTSGEWASSNGGGATDIRLISGSWDDEEGLNSRIMVAAGGGGSNEIWSVNGGNAGGLIGSSGYNKKDTNGSDLVLSTGGTQTSGGTGAGSSAKTESPYAGNFGIGGSSDVTSSAWIYRSGGGSGYYGGGTGDAVSSNIGSAAGGSSFISGYAGVNAITSSSDRTHTNDTLHYSNKYFINAKMEVGANAGNGKAKITYVSNTKPERKNTSLNNVRYIKDCINGNSETTSNHWLEIQAIYNGVNVALSKTVTSTGTINDEYGTGLITSIADGNILSNNFARFNSGNQCVTIDLGETYDLDEVAVWHYWASGRTYNDNYTYVSSNNTDWTLVIDRQEPETSEGKRVNAYDGVALQLQQNTGGTLTCKNNTTGINSTSSLEASKGDSITCTSNVNSGYRLTSLKIGNTSITSGTAFTYNYDTSVTIIPTYYRYCTQTEAYSYGSWSACSASCGGGTQTRTVYYRDKNYTSYTSCGTSTQSQSCNTGSCELSCDCAYRSSNIVSVGYYWTCSAGHSHNTGYIHYCKCWRGGSYVGTYSYDNNAYYTNGSKVVTYKWVCPTWNSYKTI